MAYEARLAKEYKERIVPALMAQFGYTSVMQVPKNREDYVSSRGLGDAIADKKVVGVRVPTNSV
jgi:large subunit ribosomal protein L5